MNPNVVAGTFVGTDASVISICCGFIPDKVLLVNMDQTAPVSIEWSILQLGLNVTQTLDQSLNFGGILTVAAGDRTKLTAALGIRPYRGGGKLAAASTTLYVADPSPDKRAANTSAAPISQWTLGNSTNFTGNFNAAAHASVGAGSRIAIRDATGQIKWYTITTMTVAGGGAGANSVTLSEAAPSGEITALRGMNTFIPAAASVGTPEGFTLGDVTLVQIDATSRCYFEASGYL